MSEVYDNLEEYVSIVSIVPISSISSENRADISKAYKASEGYKIVEI